MNSFSIETTTEAPTPNASLPKLWDALASPDPLLANDSLWKFIGAGDLAVTFLQEKLAALSRWNGAHAQKRRPAMSRKTWACVSAVRTGLRVFF